VGTQIGTRFVFIWARTTLTIAAHAKVSSSTKDMGSAFCSGVGKCLACGSFFDRVLALQLFRFPLCPPGLFAQGSLSGPLRLLVTSATLGSFLTSTLFLFLRMRLSVLESTLCCRDLVFKFISPMDQSVVCFGPLGFGASLGLH
jgi:hypothetical protein